MKLKLLFITATVFLLSLNISMAASEQKMVSAMRNKAQEIIANLSQK